MKLQRNGSGQYTVCLPKPIIESIGWQKGDVLGLKLDKGRFIISKG